jgi:hypothetical protein
MTTHRVRAPAAALLVAAALALGLGGWVSLNYVFGAWRPDPDIYVTVELWRGVRQHGLGFLSTWSYTQDNWLLSLIPFSSLAFEVLGARPWVAVGLGWFVFVLSAALTGWLAARLAGWRAGVILAGVLMFASWSAIGPAAYLGYPISHNVSMAWMLLTLILAHSAIDRGSYLAAAAAGLAVLINGVSDPWATVAVAAPLITVAAALAAAHRGSRLGRSALVLALASALALLGARTQLFGLLDFLPESRFELADWRQMLVNLYLAAKALAAMFDILPGGMGAGTAGLLNLAALALMLGTAVALNLRGFRQASPGRQLIVAAAVLSVSATAGLYLAGQWHGTGSGRFLPNLFLLGALLIAVTAADRWSEWRPALKGIVVVYAGLFVLAGLTSAPELWTRPAVTTRDDGPGLTAFLQARGLRYGYGVFWGTQALVAETATKGQVVIRPVSFRDAHIRRRPAQTSSLWYLPSDEPAAGRRFLVIRNDGEECPSVQACAEKARRQFGAPSETLAYGDALILIWPRSIAARIYP